MVDDSATEGSNLEVVDMANRDAGPVAPEVGVGIEQTGGNETGRLGEEAGTNVDPVRSAADALAGHLAAQSRFPRIFPATFWIPGAQAALSSARRSLAAARPPLPPASSPFASRDASARANAGSSSQPQRALGTPVLPPSPQPSLPLSPPLSPPMSGATFPDEESSEEMDDDQLVIAYVTPPASPVVAATPMTSPRRMGPPSRKRRRADLSRAARALSTTGPTGAGAGGDQDNFSLLDIHDALRSGFSSVRREITRLRTELVVVKSQSASALRRMDSIAAAADGRESGSGVVLERLSGIDRTLNILGDRLQKTTGGEESGGPVDARGSVTIVTEIKVCSVLCFLSCIVNARGVPTASRVSVCCVCHRRETVQTLGVMTLSAARGSGLTRVSFYCSGRPCCFFSACFGFCRTYSWKP